MTITSEGQKTTDSLNGKLTFEQDKNRIVGRDEDNLIRLLILASNNQFRIKIAQPGFDATTATGDQLVLDSNNNLFKILDTDSFVLETADFIASGNTYLDWVATEIINFPVGVENAIVWVFIENALGEKTQLPYPKFDYDTGNLTYIAQQLISENSFSVEIRSTTQLSPGVPFRYYILQETSAA